jgi:hypothetical protein
MIVDARILHGFVEIDEIDRNAAPDGAGGAVVRIRLDPDPKVARPFAS